MEVNVIKVAVRSVIEFAGYWKFHASYILSLVTGTVGGIRTLALDVSKNIK